MSAVDTNRLYKRDILSGFSALCLLIAGVLHLIIVPQVWNREITFAIVSLILGVAQIWWAVSFAGRPTDSRYGTGIIIAGAALTLWAVSAMFQGAFTADPVALQVAGLGVTDKLFEILALIGLLVWRASHHPREAMPLAGVVQLLVIAIIVGVAVYGVGQLSEQYVAAALPTAETVEVYSTSI